MDRSALIALGANLPHQGLSGPALLARAVEALKRDGLAPRRLSSIWETEPWPPSLAGQPAFFNAVVEVDPGPRTPQAIYAMLRAIEAEFGRERRERWAARTLDLDLLAVTGAVGHFEGEGEDGVDLPHPRLHERAFVLAPLSEVAPDWRHPVSGARPRDMFVALEEEQGARLWGPFPGAD